MNKILEIRHLEKGYKEHKAVRGISFDVYEGEILCILGPNGAGKSTTINMLIGALRRDGGKITSPVTNGKDISQNLKTYKHSLGIVPQDLAIYEDLTARQNVEFFASLYGLKKQELKRRTDEALTFVGLADRQTHKVNTFSGGMKRRLNIACAIAHRPSLLIMDEPTVGIDPQSRNHILASIKQLQAEGMTIIYTTHYMEEVEEISDRIIIVDHGKIIATGTKEALKERIGSGKVYYIDLDSTQGFNEDALYRIEGVKKVRARENTLEVSTIKSIENLDRIIAQVLAQDRHINSITNEALSLETVFLNLTGRSLRD